MRIEVRNNDIGAALRKMKKKLFTERVLIEYMRHTAYEKPSARRRREKAEASRRWQKERAKLFEERGY
jgi:small subunit ribosomal protein S21